MRRAPRLDLGVCGGTHRIERTAADTALRITLSPLQKQGHHTDELTDELGPCPERAQRVEGLPHQSARSRCSMRNCARSCIRGEPRSFGIRGCCGARGNQRGIDRRVGERGAFRGLEAKRPPLAERSGVGHQALSLAAFRAARERVDLFPDTCRHPHFAPPDLRIRPPVLLKVETRSRKTSAW